MIKVIKDEMIIKRLKGGVIFEIKIDKDVPIPETRGQKLIPFELMSVGDSVFIPNWNLNSASSAVYRQKRKMSNKKRNWTCRQTKEKISGEYVEGIRVWRIN